jgi:hypothetical protein
MLHVLLLAAVVTNPEISAIQIHHHGKYGVGHGSGTIVGSRFGRALVISNNHVAPTPTDKYTVTVHGKEYDAIWYATDCRADLSALLIDVPLPPVRIANELPRPGTRCHQAGYARGIRSPKSGTVGDITGCAITFREHRLFPSVWANMTNNVQSIPGDSGAGIFSDKNELFAVVWGMSTGVSGEPLGTEESVPLSEIQRFLSTLP